MQNCFVMGFTRGGTSWLRDIINSHPDCCSIDTEVTVFRDFDDLATIQSTLDRLTPTVDCQNKKILVSKAPANAPYLGKALSILPESKYIFIIRDPRDVFVSHIRGNQQWLRGNNSDLEWVMQKLEKYYCGYASTLNSLNVLLVKYEDLHQNFLSATRTIFEFLDLAKSDTIIRHCYETTHFRNVSGRGHIENRDSARRKGVCGDWGTYLSADQKGWFYDSNFWMNFLQKHGYQTEPPSHEVVLEAMANAKLISLNEEMILNSLVPDQPSLVLMNDIDLLKTKESRAGVLRSAEIIGKHGFSAIFNFLPIDDPRYQGLSPDEIVALAKEVLSLAPKASLGLHLNAAERFFPANFPDCGDHHHKMKSAVEYLHMQVDLYAEHDIYFKLATAHGYGRRKKLPNNRDSPIFELELNKRGIALFDRAPRESICNCAEHIISLSDVGGVLTAWDMPISGSIVERKTFEQLPPKSVIHYLIHPGNYPTNKPLSIASSMLS